MLRLYLGLLFEMVPLVLSSAVQPLYEHIGSEESGHRFSFLSNSMYQIYYCYLDFLLFGIDWPFFFI